MTYTLKYYRRLSASKDVQKIVYVRCFNRFIQRNTNLVEKRNIQTNTNWRNISFNRYCKAEFLLKLANSEIIKKYII